MRMLAFTRYARRAASTRQRLLQYLPHLAREGITVDWHALLDDAYLDRSLTGGAGSRLGLPRAYLARLAQLARARRYDAIWVYGELFPLLPAPFERLAAATGVPVLYDCDDAFFLAYDDHPNPLLRRLAGKHAALLRGARTALCGNAWLRDWAARWCDEAIVLPTVVDTALYRPAATPPDRVTIGWIGSPSTFRYLAPVMPVLRDVAARTGARVRIVGAGEAARDWAFPGLERIDWSEDREIAEVQAMSVGIMPAVDEPWARGKCGYKLIQYMACGLPVVATPIGVAGEIVQAPRHGLLATTADEWAAALTRLVDDAVLRDTMGAAGRAAVDARYSLSVHAPRFAAAIRAAVG